MLKEELLIDDDFLRGQAAGAGHVHATEYKMSHFLAKKFVQDFC